MTISKRTGRALFLCTGCTVCRGCMDAEERLCTGCTVVENCSCIFDTSAIHGGRAVAAWMQRSDDVTECTELY